MNYKRKLRNLADKLPYVRSLKKKVSFYESELPVPPGHFYSPLVNTSEINAQAERIFNNERNLESIDMNEDGQYKLMNLFKDYYKLLPFTENPIEGKRYFYNNSFYSYSDVIFLFSMIMHNKPRRIIEIGSGFSSAAMLDVNEQFFKNSMDITFIEPYPINLKNIIKPGDKYTLIEKKIQDVHKSIFQSLEENDILFIDSTHVAKTNSDVLFEIFEILPYLNKGVKIHFHDIFFPFEYPRKWVVEEKKNWNEIYFLRAFLMYNTNFKIVAFSTYLENIHEKWFMENMPLCLKNTGGSCWLEKVV